MSSYINVTGTLALTSNPVVGGTFLVVRGYSSEGIPMPAIALMDGPSLVSQLLCAYVQGAIVLEVESFNQAELDTNALRETDFEDIDLIGVKDKYDCVDSFLSCFYLHADTRLSVVWPLSSVAAAGWAGFERLVYEWVLSDEPVVKI